MPYETFEHTADIGLRIRAKDLNRLFQDAAEGFFNLVTDLDAIQKSRPSPLHEIEMNFQEENVEELFMRWLQELLFVFSTRKSVFLEYRFISLTPMLLKLKAKAARFDPKQHVSRHEIKAVTFHQFHVVQDLAGWLAEVIFDI
ncbi:MAG TPA: archease [Candidatus Omnitrophota bacterium]|nr:archease [Candidatus Omnitrophota bacterium]